MLQSGPRHLGLLGCAPWWSVLAAQQPKSSKTDLASLVCLAVLLALPLVVRFGRSAAQIRQNGPPLPFQPHRSLSLSLPGPPFCPLSGPNPPKRTTMGEQGTQPSRPTWRGLLSGQNGPPEGEQGAQPSRPSWRGPFWSIWAAERPKRTTRRRARSPAKQTLLARSVLDRFGGFGLLSGQNGPPEGRTSWRRSTKRGTRDRDRELRLFHRPHWTQRLYLCLLSLFPGCLLVAVAFCEILSGYTGSLPQFADHFLYARDV